MSTIQLQQHTQTVIFVMSVEEIWRIEEAAFSYKPGKKHKECVVESYYIADIIISRIIHTSETSFRGIIETVLKENGKTMIWEEFSATQTFTELLVFGRLQMYA